MPLGLGATTLYFMTTSQKCSSCTLPSPTLRNPSVLSRLKICERHHLNDLKIIPLHHCENLQAAVCVENCCKAAMIPNQKCQKKKYQWLAKVSKNYYGEGRKMQQRKCTCRRMLNIDSDQRGRIGETVIFTEVVFFDSLFCWFSPPACVGVARFGMYLVTGNTGCPYIFCSSLLLSKALNPPQKAEWEKE